MIIPPKYNYFLDNRFLWASLLLAFVAPAASAAITNLQVVGITATQALISYTTPDTGPCTIEASKSSSYSPLVHDVDSSLFPGSNMDNRPGSVGIGKTVRIIVLGKRKSELASDGKTYYSRALQAYTQHYVRVTCDNGDQATVNFQTQTIPTGQTYNDPMASDPNIPGQYTYPTVSATDRTQEIVDPQTGALIKRISLPSEGWGPGISMDFGAPRFCTPTLATDASGNKGFRCLFNGELTFINKETGEVTLLGGMATAYRPQEDGWGSGRPCGNWDTIDPNSTYCLMATYDTNQASTRMAMVQATYMGNNQPFSGNLPDCANSGQPCVKWTNLTPGHDNGNGPQDLRSMMNNFAPDFSNFILYYSAAGCVSDGISNHHSYITCQNSDQNTLAWQFVFDPGNGNPLQAGQSGGPNIIAGANTYSQAPFRWCGAHTSIPADNSQNWFFEAGEALFGMQNPPPAHNSQPGYGPYNVTLMTALNATFDTCPPQPAGNTVGNWPVGSGCNTVNVNGEPQNSQNFLGDSADPTPESPTLQPAQEGDYFALNGYKEHVRLLIKSPPNPDGSQTWTIQRTLGADAYPNGTPMTALCFPEAVSTTAYWDIADDPHGLNANGSTLIPQQSSGHEIYDQLYLVGTGNPKSNYGYDIYTGALPQLVNASETPIWANAAFDGAGGEEMANVVDSHPSYIVTDKSGRKSFVDGRPWDGGVGLGDPNGSATRVTGNVWKFAASARPLHRKQLPTLAFCGSAPMQDMSGPDANINYLPNTYCVVDQAGECISGSQTGEVYANCPNVVQPFCSYPGIAQDLSGVVSLCVQDGAPYMMQLTQTVLSGSADTTGAGTRVFTHAFQIVGWQDVYLNPRPVVTSDTSGLASDGSAWMFFRTPYPLPTAAQTLYGNSYAGIFLIRVPPLPASTQLARNDFLPTAITVPPPPSSFLADNAVIEFGYAENGPANKLYCTSRQEACVKGAQSGNNYDFLSDTVTGVSCANGCTITLPMIPQRAMYYQIQYRSGENIVGSSVLQVITEAFSTMPPMIPGTFSLPVPNLSLAAYLPLNADISASVPSGSVVDHFVWSFTPLFESPSSAFTSPTLKAAGVPAASMSTRSTSASLSQAILSPGLYLISVQSADAGGDLSGSASALTTLILPNFNGSRVYPNPWRQDKHAGQNITFDHLPLNSTIKIFTVSGHLVRQLSQSTVTNSNVSIPWDLTNDSGERVASGIYIYLVIDNQGNKTRGKLAIIR